MRFKSHNELLQAVATRARDIGGMSIQTLRMIVAEDGDTPRKAKQEVGHMTRGQLIEAILYDEFCEDEDKLFEGVQ